MDNSNNIPSKEQLAQWAKEADEEYKKKLEKSKKNGEFDKLITNDPNIESHLTDPDFYMC